MSGPHGSLHKLLYSFINGEYARLDTVCLSTCASSPSKCEIRAIELHLYVLCWQTSDTEKSLTLCREQGPRSPSLYPPPLLWARIPLLLPGLGLHSLQRKTVFGWCVVLSALLCRSRVGLQRNGKGVPGKVRSQQGSAAAGVGGEMGICLSCLCWNASPPKILNTVHMRIQGRVPESIRQEIGPLPSLYPEYPDSCPYLLCVNPCPYSAVGLNMMSECSVSDILLLLLSRETLQVR